MSGSIGQTDTHVLNADGLMESATNSNNLPSVFYYYYNSDRKLIKDTYISSGILKRTRYYEYANGNRIKDSVVEASSGFVTTYEYYPDITSTTEGANTGYLIFGTDNKNAYKKVETKYSSGTVTTRIYSKPELDASGRVSRISFSNNGSAPLVYTYTYY